MSFFSKIFGKKKTEPQAIVQDSPEVKSLFEFEQRMDTLLAQDRFIARSDFAPICRDFAPLYDTFCKLQSTGIREFGIRFMQTVAIALTPLYAQAVPLACSQRNNTQPMPSTGS